MSVVHEKKLIEGFQRHFGRSQVSLYSACGRTELGGNHTDHQNGQVLAAAVDMKMHAAAASFDELFVRVYSEGFGCIEINISDLSPRENEKGSAASLIRGVLACLADQGFRIGGFQAYMVSDIPAGAGLSSSAAFETLIGRIISGMYNDGSISYVEMARAGQFAENEYFGKPCGLMDQIACASDSLVYIDFAYDDCPIIEEIKFDFSRCGYKLCITDTGSSHADLTDQYAAIATEMEAVAGIFGRNKLRGVTIEKLLEKAHDIREKAGDRALLRALHFAGETERAKAQAEALKEGDFTGFLSLVKESGDSSYKLLQNIYAGRDQSIAIGLAVSEAVLAEDGVCRVHGGGFAGTIQAFVKDDAVDRYRTAMEKVFGDGACRVLYPGGDGK